jgi:hypothetical protein
VAALCTGTDDRGRLDAVPTPAAGSGSLKVSACLKPAASPRAAVFGGARGCLPATPDPRVRRTPHMDAPTGPRPPFDAFAVQG